MELKIPLDCNTEDEILWTEYVRVTTDPVKETASTRSDYRVDIPEKPKILTLSELEESENVEMPPLNESVDNTDSRKSASAAKQKEEFDVELKSPVSVETSVVNRNLSTPTQPTQETSALIQLIHKQSMVAPPIKSCCFKTEPIEFFQDNVSYHIRPRTLPWHEFSSSASTSVPVAA